VLHAVRTQGLVVGKDVAVAGFDGVQDARLTEPALTTLDIPVGEIARQLVLMLVKSLSGPSRDVQRIVIEPELQIRASTGG
jgi:LacI family transcriptional regulator